VPSTFTEPSHRHSQFASAELLLIPGLPVGEPEHLPAIADQCGLAAGPLVVGGRVVTLGLAVDFDGDAVRAAGDSEVRGCPEFRGTSVAAR